MTTVVYIRNLLTPQNREVAYISGSIRSLAPTWDTPFVAFLDGEPVLRADWEVVIEGSQSLAFVDVTAMPQGGGGGGSNPLRTILTIAVLAYAPYLAGEFLVAGGLGLAEAGMTMVMGTAIMQMVGMALVNALVPPPKPLSTQNSAALAAPSPTYSMQAQGNSARLESAIPEHFGRMIAYPDFAAQPYAEFFGNEQYLYQLLCIGRGEYAIESIRIEDTPIENFAEITSQVVGPNMPVQLFPASVINCAEVVGFDMSTTALFGPFTLSGPSTVARYVGIDLVCPKGLYFANDDGSLSSKSVVVKIEVQLLDNAGSPLAGWITLATETISDATTTPQRKSYRYTLATPGRYQIRVQRTDTKDTNTRAGHDVSWSGARAYLSDDKVYGDVTLLALRMKATNNLSGQSSRKINVIATRKLPIWNGTVWSGLTATRSISWAAAYAAKQMGLTDAQIDLTTLKALDTTWTSRSDNFDARFDNFVNFWEAVTKILQAGRAKPYMQGGVLRMVRDQAVSIPVTMFSQRNIVKGSFSIDYLMPTEDTADSVKTSYFDAATWAPASVVSTLAGSTALRPAKVDLFGVTSRDQAYREGLYLAAANRYRRKIIKFSTEMEGFIPSMGDLVAIQHDMPGWGQAGELVAGTPKNLIPYSEQLNNSLWLHEGTSTIVVNAALAPDGTNTADKIVETTSILGHYRYIGSTQSVGTFTASFYIKKAERQWASVQIATDTITKRYSVLVDLITGAVLDTRSVGSPINPSHVVENVGNGWFRVSVTATNTSGRVDAIVASSNSATPAFATYILPSYTGDVTKGIYAWGAQIVPGSVAAVYSKTVALPLLGYTTNLLTYSEQFNNSIWTKSNITVLSNATAAPDKTMTADLCTVTSAAAANFFQTKPATSTIMTFSIYVKAGTATAAYFGIYNNTTGLDTAAAYLTFATGVLTVSSGSGTVTALPNGWFRVSLSNTAGITVGNSLNVYPGVAGGIYPNGSNWYAWGAQLESGSEASDYIRNTSATNLGYVYTTSEQLSWKATTSVNFLKYSEQFDNAAWSKVLSATVTANTDVSPVGTTTADTVTFNTTSGNSHRANY